MEACLCIPWRLLGASVLETLKSQGLKKLVNRLSIAGGWEMCLVTKTTLHKEPLLIIYTVMYYPAESGMWTLSVNWNVRTNQAKNQLSSFSMYIHCTLKMFENGRRNQKLIWKMIWFYGVLFISYNWILKAIIFIRYWY